MLGFSNATFSSARKACQEVAPSCASIGVKTQVSAQLPICRQTASARAPVSCSAAAGIPWAGSTAADAVGDRKVVIVTGASSGVGLAAAKAFTERGWYVVMANRDYLKSVQAAQRVNIPQDSYTVIHCDLSSLESVRNFVYDFKQSGLPLDAIVANAAVYKPLLKEPERTAEGFELCVGTNHLGHFLLLNLLMDDLSASKNDPRCLILGTVTHNPNELGGKIPPQANLGDLSGLVKGTKGAVSMIDGKEFNAPKAYKDSKVCNILTMKEMAKRFNKSKGITFLSMYPGCVATTPLFRNHLPLFQYLFPLFQKNITGAFVSEELAGNRVADLITEDKFGQNGAYWSWGGRGSSGRSEAFVQQPSDEASDAFKAEKLWEISCDLVGLEKLK